MSLIHPTAIIAPQAQLGKNVSVGAYSIIGANVKIGDDSVIHAHAHIDGNTTLGQQCEVFPFACLGTKTQDLKYQAGDITYVEIGDGSVFREFCTVHSGTKPGEVTRVGHKCLVMAYCHIAHGCTVGNEVIMSNQTTLAGEVTVDDFAILGGLSAVHQFSRIGRLAMVAGGSRVRQDCPPYMILDASGETARVVGPNVVGLQRRGFGAGVRGTLKEAFKLLYREGLNRSQALERIKYEIEPTPEIQHLMEFYQSSERGVH